ncbi:hypothetical protein OTU49_011668, partial [Cherax quadricarinatus]
IFISKINQKNSSSNGVTLHKRQGEVYYTRSNLPSNKTSVNSIISGLSQGAIGSNEGAYGKIPPSWRVPGGKVTAMVQDGTHLSSNLSYTVFPDFSSKTFVGSARATKLKKEPFVHHHKLAAVVKESEVAHLRQKASEGRGAPSRLSGLLLAPVTCTTHPHTLQLLRRFPSLYTSKAFENFLGYNKSTDVHVNNVSNITSKIRENVKAHNFEAKILSPWTKRRRERQNIQVPQISGTNKKIKDSLFRVDGEAGESVKLSRDPHHEKRGAEQKKREFALFNAQPNEGQSKMAVSQEGDRETSDKNHKMNRVIRSIKAGCKGTGSVACAAKIVSDSFSSNTLDAINNSGRNNVGPSSLPNENSPGILSDRFLYKSNKNSGTDVTKSFRTVIDESLASDMVGVPVVRHRRERWSSVPWAEPNRNLLRNHTPSFNKYSRIFTKNFPQIFSNYHSGMVNKHTRPSGGELRAQPASADGNPGDERAVAQGSVADMKQDRKATRGVSVHASRTSAHPKGGSKHSRGERNYVKSLQQRHARSRNRAKRK